VADTTGVDWHDLYIWGIATAFMYPKDLVVMEAVVHACMGVIGNRFTREILNPSYTAYGAILPLRICTIDRYPRPDTDL
jgi:hypothetical protein